MSPSIIQIALLAIIFASPIICYRIAKARNANTLLWIILGMTFSIFAIPFALMIKPRPPEPDA